MAVTEGSRESRVQDEERGRVGKSWDDHGWSGRVVSGRSPSSRVGGKKESQRRVRQGTGRDWVKVLGRGWGPRIGWGGETT